jgi:hypothetical protein
VVGPVDKVIGLGEVRAASYVINALSVYRPKPLPIEDDQVSLTKLRRSIVCLGSAMSNEMTEVVETDGRNKFLRIVRNEESALIHCMLTGSLEFQRSEVRRDFGIVLKIINSRFPGNFFFVCAGLGEWGTSGAAWYLANHWKDLDDFGEEFGCVVEVEIGSDESARLVYTPPDAQARSSKKRRETRTEPAPASPEG